MGNQNPTLENFSATVNIRTNPGTAAVHPSLSDTEDFTITDGSAPLDQNVKYARGFIACAAGTMRVLSPGQTGTADIVVNSGQEYHIGVQRFYNTGTTLTASQIVAIG